MATTEEPTSSLAEKYDFALSTLELFLDQDPWTSRETKLALMLEDILLRLKTWGHEIGYDDGILTEVETKNKGWGSAIRYFLYNIQDCIEQFAVIRERVAEVAAQKLYDAENILDRLSGFVRDLTSDVMPFVALREMKKRSGFIYSLKTGSIHPQIKQDDIDKDGLSQKSERHATKTSQEFARSLASKIAKQPAQIVRSSHEDTVAPSTTSGRIPAGTTILRDPAVQPFSDNPKIIVRDFDSADKEFPKRAISDLRSSTVRSVISPDFQESGSFQTPLPRIVIRSPTFSTSLSNYHLPRPPKLFSQSMSGLERSYEGLDIHQLTATQKWDMVFDRVLFWSKAPNESESFLEDYVYRPLTTPTSIRLVKIMPSMFGVDLKCEIFEVQAQECSQGHLLAWDCDAFEAISWVWSRETPCQNLWIRDGSIGWRHRIPSALEQCLKAFRLELKPRNVWIDYLCLDRSNSREVTSQPWLFHSVFAAAIKVCAWLGDKAQDSDLAMNFIRTTAQRSSSWWTTNLVGDFDKESRLPRVLSLLQRPWFSRRWIVQEIAWSRQCEMYCGSETLTWTDFSAWVTYVAELESLTGRPTFPQTEPQGGLISPGTEIRKIHAYQLVETCNHCFRQGDDHKKLHTMSLEYLVTSLSQFHVSMPHDAIYSVLSLAAETDSGSEVNQRGPTVLSEKPVARIDHKSSRFVGYPVNYEHAYDKICLDFVRFSVFASGSLNIICRPWAPEPTDSFYKYRSETKASPSWVAKMKQTDSGHSGDVPITSSVSNNGEVLVGLPITNGCRYKASMNKMVDLEILKFRSYQTHSSMSVRGFVLTDLKSIASTSLVGDIPRDWPSFSGWTNVDLAPPECYWRALLADQGLSGGRAHLHYRRVVHELYLTFAERSLTTEIVAAKVSTTNITPHVRKIVQKIQNIISNRRLGRISRGNALSLVPQGAQEGDLICILYGCSVPVVLRKCFKTHVETWEQRSLNMQEERAAVLIQRFYRNWTQRRLSQPQHKAYQMAQNDQLTSETIVSRAQSLGNLEGVSIQIICLFLYLMLVRPWLSGISASLDSALISGLSLPLLWSVRILLRTLWTTRDSNNAKPDMHITTDKARAPLILSPPVLPHMYKLVGECYVHGMMDGEALIAKENDGLVSEIFEIT